MTKDINLSAVAARDLFSINDCVSCSEGIERNECPSSKRECGHHCNHIWPQEACCWCGLELEPE